jgi:hypothetical protein
MPWPVKLYKTERWKRRSLRQLQMVPCCEHCTARGETTIATLSHHSEEHLPGMHESRFWTIPLISLCDACHRATHGIAPSKGLKRQIGLDGWPVFGPETLSYEEQQQRKKPS